MQCYALLAQTKTCTLETTAHTVPEFVETMSHEEALHERTVVTTKPWLASIGHTHLQTKKGTSPIVEESFGI